MKNSILKSVSILFILTLSLGSVYAQKVKGNGKTVNKTRNVGSFDGIGVAGSFDVFLVSGDEGKLEIRPVEVLFREKDHVIVNGSLDEGERLITTTLSSPIPGTLLRVEGDQQGQAMKRQGKGQGEGRKSGEE